MSYKWRYKEGKYSRNTADYPYKEGTDNADTMGFTEETKVVIPFADFKDSAIACAGMKLWDYYGIDRVQSLITRVKNRDIVQNIFKENIYSYDKTNDEMTMKPFNLIVGELADKFEYLICSEEQG